MKVVIAGGGTGGHLFPALAVAEVLQERGDEVVIFISEKEIDALATRDRDEFKFEKLPSIGMPKFHSPAILGFLKRFAESLSPCRSLYRKFKPDAVLGMGGFTSTAPILAGKMAGIPTFLHESNAIPGKANRLNAKMAKKVFLGFEECAAHFGGASCEVTGTPIRKTLATPLPKEEALAALNLQPGLKTLLVMGGSQGARGINQALIKVLPLFGQMGLQIIHLTGLDAEQVMVANYRREGLPAYVSAFCNRMEAAYSAADLAISRSGAASLSELSLFGLPSILIPYPHAAENHQALNAAIFERAGAAEVLEQEKTNEESLSAKISSLLENPGRLEKMAVRSRELAVPNAARRVVEAIARNLN